MTKQLIDGYFGPRMGVTKIQPSEPKSISMEEAAAFGDPTLVDREVPHEPNHTVLVHREIYPVTQKTIIQDHSKGLNHISFYEIYHENDPRERSMMLTDSTVCIWHIKPKLNA